MVSSMCFELEGSSSGRRLYEQIGYIMFYMHRYRQSPPPTRRPTPMHVKHDIAYRCVQPSSWRWTLGFETCRRQHGNKSILL